MTVAYRTNLTGFLFLSMLFLASHSAIAELLPQDIAKKADLIRFPEGSYMMNITIINKKPNNSDVIRGYQVLAKDRESTLVKFTFPQTERGKVLLTLDQDIWIYLPDAGMPIRIPPQQRLIGNVSVGDIARANFSEDYSAKILEIKNIDGTFYYVLNLRAKNDEVTYQKVTYWVQKETFHPLKAEFYTKSGRLIKTAFYENYNEVLGVLRPKKMRIIDGIRNDHISILEYENMHLKSLPNKIFNKNYLKKLE